MARITDTERGARIALDIASARILQPHMFGDRPDYAFWQSVRIAAQEQLIECKALRAAQS